MNNNDIFKKLRVALQLRDDQIVEILELVDFKMSKTELGAFFRTEDNPNYMECGDQVLRNFLNGLVIHLRGTKDNPKNAMDVINQNQQAIRDKNSGKSLRDSGPKTTTAKPKTAAKPYKKNTPAKATPKLQVVEKVKFNNGKKKG